MRDRTVVITGATNGIGRIAAETLARDGARLVIVGRDRAKTDGVLGGLRRSSPQSAAVYADLAVQAEVRRAAAEILALCPRIDVLINNAGALFTTRETTVDGLERTFALNHVGYFLLTTLLLDRLRSSAPARIVSVASGAHRRGEIHWDDLQLTRSWPAGGWGAYGQSKLANILFTRELARRLAGSGVTANCMHPGMVDTGFGKTGGRLLRGVMWLTKPIQRTPEQGADTLVWAARAPELDGVTGRYFKDRKDGELSAAAQDDGAARRLWEVTEALVGRSSG
mgnify:CR=1 FL=1